ncbi:histone H3-K9 methyltransferase KMT1 [Allomyces arbusculus]|nr:histone H3-K9 methyltransferase KMT1 [Allomyces arbusculus]
MSTDAQVIPRNLSRKTIKLASLNRCRKTSKPIPRNLGRKTCKLVSDNLCRKTSKPMPRNLGGMTPSRPDLNRFTTAATIQSEYDASGSRQRRKLESPLDDTRHGGEDAHSDDKNLIVETPYCAFDDIVPLASFSAELAKDPSGLISLDRASITPSTVFPPRAFTYTSTLLYSPRASAFLPPVTALPACSFARGTCASPTSPCSCTAAGDAYYAPHGTTMAYTPTGRLRDVLGLPHDALRTLHVLECTARCKCGPFCANRVVQRGSQVPVEVIWDDAVGWGVRAKRDVEKGEFVMQYLGRVVAEDECGSGVEGRYEFALDLDEGRGVGWETRPMLVVDAEEVGNVARFLNHACDPNLLVVAVRFDSLVDEGLYRIAFFARRDIAAYEPLCFDYEGGPELPAGARTRMGDLSFRCRCGSARCRRIIFPLLVSSDEDSDGVESDAEVGSDEGGLSYLSDL